MPARDLPRYGELGASKQGGREISMFCSQCGCRLTSGVAFCSSCGSAVSSGNAQAPLGAKRAILQVGHVESQVGDQFGISIMLHGDGSGHYVLTITPEDEAEESQAFFTDPRGLTQIKHLIAEAERTAEGCQKAGQLQRFGYR